MNIISFYNKNRIAIWITIITIILIIMVIHMLNQLVIDNKKENKNQNTEPKTSVSDYKENPKIDTLVKQEDVDNNKEMIVDQFIRFCNNGNINEAYNLLSDSCKKNLYPDLQTFKTNYINIVYTSTKLYSKESYLLKTYKVKLYDDIMSSGSLGNSFIEDYFTIEEVNKNVKLNISGFIQEEQINKSNKYKELNVNVVSKKIFKEYEEYTLEVSNLTNKDILLDSFEKTRNIYGLDNNEVKYYCAINEKSVQNLLIPANTKKVVTLKIVKEYSISSKSLRNLIFGDVIEDYNEYQKLSNKSQYTGRKGYKIEL